MSEPEFAVRLAYPRELDEHGHPVCEVVEFDEGIAGDDPRHVEVSFEGSNAMRPGVIARDVPLALAYIALDAIGARRIAYAGWNHPI